MIDKSSDAPKLPLEDSSCPFAHNEEELRSTGLFYKKTQLALN